MIWKPNTLPNAHLAWMAILDASSMTGKKYGAEHSEDYVTFWLRTCAVCTLFGSGITGILVYLFARVTG